MTDTSESTPAPTAGPGTDRDADPAADRSANGSSRPPAAPRKGLSSMVLPELRALAGGLGIKATGLRKGELIDAIRAAQSGGERSAGSEGGRVRRQAGESTPPEDGREAQPGAGAAPARQEPRQESDQPQQEPRQEPQQEPQQRPQSRSGEQQREEQSEGPPAEESRKDAARVAGGDGQRPDQQGGDPQERKGSRQQDRNENRQQDARQQGTDEEGAGSRRNRRRRGRDRAGTTGPSGSQPGQSGQGGHVGAPGQGGGHGPASRRNEPDLQILEDDVLAPCAGILDLMDNYAFVRTSGYLPGADDVYVSMSMVRKYGLRRGDAVTGQVRQPREGERREKYNPLVKIDSVNGAEPEASKSRAEFARLTPLSPQDRLRLETSSSDLTGRVIDVVAPVGKGQRGLIVSPARAGKTSVLHAVARAVTANNPECHLMVVLVDERPEEVTDYTRSVKGEVISSTFDRPPADHTLIAELAVERAKRLVELGHDVVVLLDGITRLGRAYNLSSPAGGRTLAGGVDAAALYPPKRFFGAARNIEDGGSLTILATVVVESGSTLDEIIFEELSGTANWELRLRRELAEAGIFPAVDPAVSGTRHEEELLGPEELAIVRRLRRSVTGAEGWQGVETLLDGLRATQNNIEYLTQVQRSTPVAARRSR